MAMLRIKNPGTLCFRRRVVRIRNAAELTGVDSGHFSLRHVLDSLSRRSFCLVMCLSYPRYVVTYPLTFSRMLSGLALRQCVELGLHRKIIWSKTKSNPLKVELRKRVFWCSYNLDRAVAFTLGRPVGIADDDIDVEVSFRFWA